MEVFALAFLDQLTEHVTLVCGAVNRAGERERLFLQEGRNTRIVRLRFDKQLARNGLLVCLTGSKHEAIPYVSEVHRIAQPHAVNRMEKYRFRVRNVEGSAEPID